MTRLFYVLKYICAFLLLISLFLPFSSCNQKLAPDAFRQSKNDPQKPLLIEKKSPEITYVYKQLDFAEFEDFLVLLTFIWPVVLTIVQQSFHHQIYKYIFITLALILPVGSAYKIWTIIFFEEPLYGAYVAISSITCYFLITSVEVILNIRTRIRKKRI